MRERSDRRNDSAHHTCFSFFSKCTCTIDLLSRYATEGQSYKYTQPSAVPNSESGTLGGKAKSRYWRNAQTDPRKRGGTKLYVNNLCFSVFFRTSERWNMRIVYTKFS